MRFSYSLKRFDSPRFSAFSRIPMSLSVEARVACSGGRRHVRAHRRGSRLAPLAALVAMALDLPRELLRAEVDRVRAVPRRVARAEHGALDVQRHLGDLAVGNG